MKCKFLVACLLVGLLSPRLQAATDFYVNDGVVIAPPEIPPQVDATNFVNNNYFSINFTNFLFLPQLYETDNTLNFTNNGVMIANSGFRFDWFVKTNVGGQKGHKLAANFVNHGTISSGSAANNTNLFAGLFLLSPGLPKLNISATNVSLRSSTNIVGVDGLLTISGKHVDLNRARISMEGFEDTPTNIFGILNTVGLTAGYWGVGTNVLTSAFNFGAVTPFTPAHLVVLPGGFIGFRQLVLQNPTFHVDEFVAGTNRFVQAVFVNNTNPAIQNNVYFPFNGVAVVEWLGRFTNQVSGTVSTNTLYLTDDFGTLGTNTVLTNFSYYTAAGTAIPINYNFTRVPPFFFGLGPAFPPTSPAGIFDPVTVTNQFAAFGAVFAPSTVNLTNLPLAGRYLTNLPGRIEITADSVLDLTAARISGLNYLALKATNHVSSVNGAKISVPFSDISLGTTNGRLALTNLLFPVIQRFTGEVDLWSGRWTNDFGGFNTIYSVLFVDSKLSATAPSMVQDLTLRSTNIVISDILNVTRNLMLNAERVTLTTNQQPAATPRGELNLLSSAITWSTSTPRLQYLTNNGGISSLNAVFLGGSRGSPFYSSNFNEPYLAFVNRGVVSTEGSLIWADYFENSGLFNTRSGFGSLTLEAANALMTNGAFVALNGAISLTSSSLVISNHPLQSGRGVTLNASNHLSDGYPLANQFGDIVTTNTPFNSGITNGNFWFGRGFSLLTRPSTGDLLATSISNTAPTFAEVVNRWAGEDRGCSAAGFVNNGAVGRLILHGGEDSLFTFNGTGESNALYVDYLELSDFTATRDTAGNFVNISIAPNMKIYFAQAVASGSSIAEKLNGANGGRFCWVNDYAGAYSSADKVYPDGNNYRFNAALLESCTEDSDGDGIVNCADATPVLVSGSLDLSVALVSQNGAPAASEISWNSSPYAMNYVYFTSPMASTNWQVLTNFVLGPVGGRVSIIDPGVAESGRFYRVRVEKP